MSEQPQSYLSDDRTEKILDWAVFKRSIKYLKPYKFNLILAFIALICSQMIPFFYPGILQRIIDGPLKNHEFSGVLVFVGLYFILIISQSILSFTSNILSQKTAFRVIHDLRKDLFNVTSHYVLRFFHKTPIGRLMTRMGNDVDSLNSLFSEGIMELTSAILMIAFSLIFMFYEDWRLALCVVAVFPFMFLTTHIFRIKVRDINREIRSNLADLNTTLQENLNGIQVVQFFGKQPSRFEIFKKSNENYLKAYLINIRYYSWFFPTINTLSELTLFFCYLLGASLVFDHQTTVGTLVAFAWFAGMFTRPLRDISDKITQLQSAVAAGERVFGLMEANALEKNGSLPIPPGPISVEFKNIQFAYDEKPILKDVSFCVPSGHHFAIVGATGSGKSTIMSLVNRFYQPQSGEVYLNKTPLANIDKNSLRGRVALVSQDIFLFSDTIAQNITMGETPDPIRLQEALEKSRAWSFVQDLGVNSILNDAGRNLSAGQKQLLSFARALYIQPDLILLDEATSAIDSQTEKYIQEGLSELLKNRSAIIIAHRLSTIAHCDQILVLHQGELKEQGTHDELLKQGGIYHKLFEMNALHT